MIVFIQLYILLLYYYNHNFVKLLDLFKKNIVYENNKTYKLYLIIIFYNILLLFVIN